MITEKQVYSVTFKYRESININDSGVKAILYHEPKGEGDRHYVDMILKTGNVMRFFNPRAILFSGDKKEDEQ